MITLAERSIRLLYCWAGSQAERSETMSHKAQMKGAKKHRGAKRGGISQAKANRSNRQKVLPMEVLLGEKPFK